MSTTIEKETEIETETGGEGTATETGRGNRGTAGIRETSDTAIVPVDDHGVGRGNVNEEENEIPLTVQDETRETEETVRGHRTRRLLLPDRQHRVLETIHPFLWHPRQQQRPQPLHPHPSQQLLWCHPPQNQLQHPLAQPHL